MSYDDGMRSLLPEAPKRDNTTLGGQRRIEKEADELVSHQRRERWAQLDKEPQYHRSWWSNTVSKPTPTSSGVEHVTYDVSYTMVRDEKWNDHVADPPTDAKVQLDLVRFTRCWDSDIFLAQPQDVAHVQKLADKNSGPHAYGGIPGYRAKVHEFRILERKML